MNEKYLMAATTKIVDTKICRDIYTKSLPKEISINDVYDKYTICTKGISDVDLYGNYVPRDVSSRRYGHNETVKVQSLL